MTHGQLHRHRVPHLCLRFTDPGKWKVNANVGQACPFHCAERGPMRSNGYQGGGLSVPQTPQPSHLMECLAAAPGHRQVHSGKGEVCTCTETAPVWCLHLLE